MVVWQVECPTVNQLNREVRGSRPLVAVLNLGRFVHPTLPVSFACDTKGPFYLVSMPGKEVSHTEGKYVTCNGDTLQKDTVK